MYKSEREDKYPDSFLLVSVFFLMKLKMKYVTPRTKTLCEIPFQIQSGIRQERLLLFCVNTNHRHEYSFINFVWLAWLRSMMLDGKK